MIARRPLALWLALAWRCASADEPSATPDPTAITPLPAPSPPALVDRCDASPRCRLERSRAMLAHRRRLEYLREVERAALDLDDRITRALPFRSRFPFAADLLVVSSSVLPGVAIGFLPLWWLKLQAFAGRYSHGSYSYANRYYADATVEGGILGAEVKAMPIRWALSPYATAGFSYVDGEIRYSNSVGSGSGHAVGHLVSLGLGVDLVVPYFHIAVGYQFNQAFYAQAYTQQRHDDLLRSGLQANFDDGHHGVAFEIGCAF